MILRRSSARWETVPRGITTSCPVRGKSPGVRGSPAPHPAAADVFHNLRAAAASWGGFPQLTTQFVGFSLGECRCRCDDRCERSRHFGVATPTVANAAASCTQTHHRAVRNHEPRLTPHPPDSGMSSGTRATAFSHHTHTRLDHPPTRAQHVSNGFSPIGLLARNAFFLEKLPVFVVRESPAAVNRSHELTRRWHSPLLLGA